LKSLFANRTGFYVRIFILLIIAIIYDLPVCGQTGVLSDSDLKESFLEFIDQEQFEQAEIYFDSLLETYSAQFGTRDARYLPVLYYRAYLDFIREDYEMAAKRAKECLDISRELVLSDSVIVDYWQGYSLAFWYGKRPKEALSECRQLLHFTRDKLGADHDYYGKILRMFCIQLQRTGEYDEAAHYFREKLEFYEKRGDYDQEELARARFDLSQIYNIQTRLEEADSLLNLSIAFYEDQADLSPMLEFWYGLCLRELGQIAFKLGDPTAAIQYFQRTESIYNSIEPGDLDNIVHYRGLVKAEMGSAYSILGNNKLANNLITDAMELLGDSGGVEERLAAVLSQLANIFYVGEKYNKALEALRMSDDILNRDKEFRTYYLNQNERIRAKIFIRQNKLDDALAILESQAREIKNEFGEKELGRFNIYHLLISLYYQKNEAELALEYCDKVIEEYAYLENINDINYQDVLLHKAKLLKDLNRSEEALELVGKTKSMLVEFIEKQYSYSALDEGLFLFERVKIMIKEVQLLLTDLMDNNEVHLEMIELDLSLRGLLLSSNRAKNQTGINDSDSVDKVGEYEVLQRELVSPNQNKSKN
jgi:tetratricopeptide (TPR) repeat protein